MKYLLFIFVFVVICCGTVNAQKGIAESGYYPPGYNGGDTWTGEITAVDEDKQTITLTYKKKDKEEHFAGVLIKDYWGLKDKDGNYQTVELSRRLGYRMKAYYSSKSKKDESGTKIKFNQIYIIKIVSKDE